MSTSLSTDSVWLAWGGWRMRIPADWRALKIEGGRQRGALMLGDGDRPVAQVKWSRTGGGPGRPFDPRQWLARRLGSDRAKAIQPGKGPAPAGFEVLAWLSRSKVLPAGRGRPAPPAGASWSLWYGLARSAGLLVEVVIYSQDRPTLLATMSRQVLPSLRATGPQQPTDWAVFQAGFRTPTGFDVQARQLTPGHMCLLFEAPAGADRLAASMSRAPAGRRRALLARFRGRQRLLLRQVYPAGLALGRKDLPAWLRGGPFPERRRFYPAGQPETWSAESFGRTLAGLIRRGQKRLPWPLGWASRLFSVAAAVRDADLDRLLLAEHDSPLGASEQVVAEAIAAMNWATWAPDGK